MGMATQLGSGEWNRKWLARGICFVGHNMHNIYPCTYMKNTYPCLLEKVEVTNVKQVECAGHVHNLITLGGALL